MPEHMKLFIQIPCLNEEQTLPLVLKDIPKKIAGIDQIEILIIDDGCTDDTVRIAKKMGVRHFVHHRGNQGLAKSFRDGLWYSLEHGADIIVNTDGDNQYPSALVPELIAPILKNQADFVIADRQIATIDHFSRGKKLFQKVGTRVLNFAANTNVPDAPSGFRAYSREAALRINIVTRFSYAMEALVQVGHKGISITSIPITVNPQTRESRLFKNHTEYVFKSGIAIARVYVMYRPYALFFSLGSALLVGGLVPFVRYFYFVKTQGGAHHLQSLILGTVLLTASFIAYTLGVIAGLVDTNRSLAEDQLELQKRQLLITDSSSEHSVQ